MLTNDSSRENCAEDVGDVGDACKKEINQHDAGDQQSTGRLIAMKLGGTDGAHNTHESAGNISGNHELVTIARNGETRVNKEKDIVRNQLYPCLPL